MTADSLADARERIRDADGIVLLTGAGVSAESGVPTFRGEDGLWKSHRPEELATPQAFAADPRLVWEWYDMRRTMIGECRPNPGHEAIARLMVERDDVHLVTQNVDGLHELALAEAGSERTPERRPLRLHGSIFHMKCTACSYSRPDRDPVDSTGHGTLPRCPECEALLRPDVVWFGEALDPNVLQEAFDRAGAAGVCLVVGTSAVVQPAASVPLATLRSGGSLIEVNPEPTPLSDRAALSLRGPSGEILPEILA